jgi:hypothetical protein
MLSRMQHAPLTRSIRPVTCSAASSGAEAPPPPATLGSVYVFVPLGILGTLDSLRFLSRTPPDP